MKPNITLVLILFLLSTPCRLSFAQEVNINLGHEVKFKSEILNKERELLIHLPDNYDKTDKAYPVLFRLDGSNGLMLETVSVVNRLTYSEEITPEMIIVAIRNTDRNKDLWPTNTKYYPEPNTPGASRFLEFIGEELVPHIEKQYRTTQERILCGQSLSSVFVLYTFLTQPELFDSYIGVSAAFPDCEEYFKKLAKSALLEKDKYEGKKIILSNGMKDPLDPAGVSHQQILDFFDMLSEETGTELFEKYFIYNEARHVPFQGLYDALYFIYSNTPDTLVIKEIDKELYVCSCKPNISNPGGEGKIYYQGKYIEELVTKDADYRNCDERFLVQWDLSGIPKDVAIIEAHMEIYCRSFSGDKNGQLIYEYITEPWDENIGFSKTPATSTKGRVYTDWPEVKEFHRIDITGFVKDWYENKTPNFGLLGYSIHTDTKNSAVFCSSNFPDENLRPRLTIIYKNQLAEKQTGF